MSHFTYAVILFLKDKKLDVVSVSDIEVFSEVLERCSTDKRVSCTVSYDFTPERCFLIQALRDKPAAETFCKHCMSLRSVKKYTFEKIIDKFPRLQPESRQKLTPIKCLATDRSDDSDSDVAPALPYSSTPKPSLPQTLAPAAPIVSL